MNRIDSRARGNAPQLLEKYRKLAHDSHLNGDRVTEEYYLQFADHYFRVIADSRVRQEEGRQRRDDRWQEGGDGEREYGDEALEYGYDAYDDRARPAPRQPQDDGGRRGFGGAAQGDYGRRAFSVPQDERGGGEREPRQPQRFDRADASDDEAGEASDARNPYEPPENPFIRDGRGNRGLKERRSDRGPRPFEAEAPRAAEPEPVSPPDTLDVSAMPPAIGQSAERAEEAESRPEAQDGEERPRRRGRPRRRPADDAGETLQAVS